MMADVWRHPKHQKHPTPKVMLKVPRFYLTLIGTTLGGALGYLFFFLSSHILVRWHSKISSSGEQHTTTTIWSLSIMCDVSTNLSHQNWDFPSFPDLTTHLLKPFLYALHTIPTTQLLPVDPPSHFIMLPLVLLEPVPYIHKQ